MQNLTITTTNRTSQTILFLQIITTVKNAWIYGDHENPKIFLEQNEGKKVKRFTWYRWERFVSTVHGGRLSSMYKYKQETYKCEKRFRVYKIQVAKRKHNQM